MKKRFFSVLLTLCMVITLLPTVALAAGPTAPSVSGTNIYANGAYLLLEDGETSNCTKVSYKLAESDPWIVLSEYDNKDLSAYTIFGGVYSGNFDGDSNITIDGGCVGDVHGGNYYNNLTGNVTIVMNGGSVKRLLACGLWANVGGAGKTASITITGGTVRGGANDDIELNARNNAETTTLLITGCTINGTIAGATPTNGTNPVCKTTLTLKGYDENTVNDTAVTALTTTPSCTYGMTDVKTNADGKLYIYLPAGTTVTAATIDGVSYTNSDGITVSADGSAGGELKKATPDAPNCTFSFDGENAGKLMGATTDMEYSLHGGASYSDCTEDMELAAASITVDNDIKVRIKTPAGDVQTIDITKAAMPTGVSKTDCSTAANNDGSLTSVTAAMEYDDNAGFASPAGCGGTTVTGLANGTYYVRVKAAGTALASDYVTLTIAAYTPLSGDKAITAFSVGGAVGTIDEPNHTITVTVPYGTTLSELTPTITHSGVSVSPASGAAQNFSTPVTYTVTAENASTQEYVVTVTVALPKLLTVTAPSPVTLTSEYESAVAVIAGAELPNTVTITAENSATTLPCVWTPPGTYSAAAGAANTFHWAAATTGYDVNGKTVSGNVTITNKAAPKTVATPVITPNGGAFTGTQTFTITCGTEGATIYYTTDGAAPTSSSTEYTSTPLTVSATTTVKAIAVKDGMTNSAVVSAIFTKRTYSTGGGYTPPTYTVPVESGTGSVNASATVSGSTANVSVNNSKLNDLLADSNTTGSVSIDAGLNKNIDTATIPTTVIDKIADAANDSGKEVTGLEVALDSGTVSLDAKALAAASEQATGSTISIHVEKIAKTGLTATQKEAITGEHADDLIVEVTIKSGNTVISDYDGGLITVTLPYELKEGEIASGVQVWHLALDGSLTLMECRYDEASKTVSFVTDHLSDFIVGYDRSATWVNPFSDVKKGDYFYDAVLWAVNEKITIGTSATTFSPADSCTRAQMATLLWRAASSPEPTATVNPFADVSAGDYYYKAVLWAVEKGITTGTSATTFEPDEAVTRAQTVTFLWRAAGKPAVNYTMPFTDVDVTQYYAEAVRWAVFEGITGGTSSTTFSPANDCTRAQIVTFLYRDFSK